MNNNKKKIIIVGAGAGGITLACYLSKAGHEVQVYEKNEFSGGRCSLIFKEVKDKEIKGKFRFDQGASMYMMPHIFENVYKDLGMDLNKEIKLIQCDPNYNVFYDDGTNLTLTSNLVEMKNNLENIEKGSFDNFLKMMKEGHEHHEISCNWIMENTYYNWYNYLHLGNLDKLFKLRVWKTHFGGISKFFKSDKLRKAFTFQNMYMGLSPFEAPYAYTLLQYSELADGIWYPKGGMYHIFRIIKKKAIEYGAKFYYSSPVKQILLNDKNEAIGIKLENNKEIHCDIVVCNADLTYVYNKLLPTTDYQKCLNNKQYTSSTISFYWGIKGKIQQLDSHNIFIAKDYKPSFDKIFKDNTLPNDPSFYVHVPSKLDPTAAPDNCETVAILVPIGHLSDSDYLKNDKNKQKWDKLTEIARETVLKKFEQIGIKNIRSRIIIEDINTPITWESKFNLYKGSALGLNHQITQVGYLRPPNRDNNFKNLYFVGASTHPGTGVPMVIKSAKLVALDILNLNHGNHKGIYMKYILYFFPFIIFFYLFFYFYY